MMDKAMPRQAVAGLVLAIAVMAAGMTPAAAQPTAPEHPMPWSRDKDDGKSAGELAREGFQRLLQALEGAARAIPQYALPEINENGDIIIRRKNPPAQSPRAYEPEMDRTTAREI